MKIPFVKAEKNNKSDEEVVNLSIDSISTNPYQPRGNFNSEEIIELAESIKNYGVIQPIIVRESGKKFQLIAGERRLRACKSLSFSKIPAVIRELNDKEVAEIALVENLQRKDLNFLEEAAAYENIINKFDMTQKELAEKIGKSQSTIANKLRLLSLETDVRQMMLSIKNITERHARALLKVDEKNKRKEIVEKINKENLTVKETEKIIDRLNDKKNKKKREIKAIYKDLRLFTNSLENTVEEMKKAGLDVEVNTTEKNDYIEFNIKLPKKLERKE